MKVYRVNVCIDAVVGLEEVFVVAKDENEALDRARDATLLEVQELLNNSLRETAYEVNTPGYEEVDDSLIEALEYKDKFYPIRWVRGTKVATEELLDDMQELFNEMGTVEEKIDSQITHYVSSNDIGLPSKELELMIDDLEGK